VLGGASLPLVRSAPASRKVKLATERTFAKPKYNDAERERVERDQCA